MIGTLLMLALLGEPLVIDGRDISGFTVPQLYSLSDEYWHVGDYVTCVKLMQRVIELDETNVEAYGLIAWLIWSGREDPDDPNYMGTEADARRYLEDCVRLNPDSAEACWELGSHLLDRNGDAAGALPWLQRSLDLPDPEPLAIRTVGHALFFAERYAEAVAHWERAEREWGLDLTVVNINRSKALERALQPDSLARSGGVINGPPNPVEAAVVLRDLRERGPEVNQWFRTLYLEDPHDRDGEPDYRVRYEGREVTYRLYWRWTEIAVDRNDDGEFSDDEITMTDADADGSPDGGVTLDAMRARLAGELSPTRRRFEAAELWRVGVGADGQSATAAVSEADGAVVVAPVASILSELQPMELALYARLPRDLERRRIDGVPLRAGAYATNQTPGHDVSLRLAAGELPEGRYLLFVELKVLGVKIAEEPIATHVAVVRGGKVTLDSATEEDLHPPTPNLEGLPGDPGGPGGPPPEVRPTVPLQPAWFPGFPTQGLVHNA